MLDNLYQLFWKDEYWFPHGYTWADMEDSDGVTYPHPRDLLLTIPLTIILVTFRYGFERTIAATLARVMGIRDSIRLKATPNPILESFFRTQSRNPEEVQMKHLAKQCGLSLKQTQRWFRHRRNQDRPSLTMKFSEANWRFLFYFSSSLGGFLTLYNEPWFWESKLCFKGYPKQPLKPTLYYWYLIEISFYLSLLLTLKYDVKRKDNKEQIIHHFLAIALMVFSYCDNLVQIGAIVLLLHDVADFLLEASKMFHYAKWKRTSEIMFIIFAVVFIVSRLIFFPTKILYVTCIHFRVWMEPFLIYYFSNTLLIILQGLHIFWSYLILCMVYSFVVDKKLESDVRSDLEEKDTSDDESERERQKNMRLQSNDDTNSCNVLRSRGPRNNDPNQLTNMPFPAA